MRLVVLLLLYVLVLTDGAFGQAVRRDPKVILSAAAAALEAATTVTFSGESRGSGALGVSEPVVRAHVVIDSFKAGKPEAWRLAVSGTQATQDPAQSGPFEIHSDVDGAYFFNHAEREIVLAETADISGLLGIAGHQMVGWLIEWKDAVTAVTGGGVGVTATWEGQRSVAGEFCDVIRIDSSVKEDAETDAWWFISVTDKLPRRVDRLVQTERGVGMVSLEIADLQVSEAVDPGAFARLLPLDYSKVEYKPEVAGPKYKWRSRGRLAAGALAADFTLTTATGQERRLSDLRGRVVVLAFWTSWSKPSVEMLKKVGVVAAKFKEKPVTVWALSSSDHGDPVAVFGELKLGFEMLPSADAVARRMGVQDLPAIVVVGPDGRTLATVMGGGEAEVKAAGEAVEKGLAATGAGK